MVRTELRVGDIYRNPDTRRRFRIMSLGRGGIVAECLDAPFPEEPVCTFSMDLFCFLMRREEEAVAEEFERYLESLSSWG
jgi:hypothetical protein